MFDDFLHQFVSGRLVAFLRRAGGSMLETGEHEAMGEV